MDIGGLRRKLADSDGHWRTLTDNNMRIFRVRFGHNIFENNRKRNALDEESVVVLVEAIAVLKRARL